MRFDDSFHFDLGIWDSMLAKGSCIKVTRQRIGFFAVTEHSIGIYWCDIPKLTYIFHKPINRQREEIQ